MKYFSIILLIAFVISLSGCNETKQSEPTFTVTKQEFKVEVDGFGEIEAAQAQRIVSPGRRPMTIAWLAEENSIVKKGDIIAKFDSEQIEKNSRQEELQMALIEQDIVQSKASRSQQSNEIESEQGLVKFEFDFADKFAIDDVRVYSKLEILDTMQNRDFLGAKEQFLDWKEGSIVEQNASELAVLGIQRRSHEEKFERHQSALSQLQVYAPYDGLLTYEKDRRGDKPSIGQTVFPGRPIAKIPNLDNMQAKLYVLSKEAIDLAVKQSAVVTLDAFPNRNFSGNITHVSGYPRSIRRGDPVNYYEVTIELLEQDKALMQPGRKLTATITSKTQPDSILVPLQALHHSQGSSYVYLQKGDGFVQRKVTPGQKNLFFVAISDGLEVGDVIALSEPLLSDPEQSS